jgi:hypothetical protein
LTPSPDGLEGKGVFNGYASDVQAVIRNAGISDRAASPAQWKQGGLRIE